MGVEERSESLYVASPITDQTASFAFRRGKFCALLSTAQPCHWSGPSKPGSLEKYKHFCAKLLCSNDWLRVKGPNKQLQNEHAWILWVDFLTADCKTIEQLGSCCSSGMCLFVAYTNANIPDRYVFWGHLTRHGNKNSLDRFGDVSSMTTLHHFYARKGGGEGM